MPGAGGTASYSDDELRRRGMHTLLAAWDEYARGARGAAVLRRPGVAAAVFPHEPERGVYNNAVLALGLDAPARAAALDAAAAAYAAAGIAAYALWTHEGDEPMRRDLEARGYALAEPTRAMGMSLDRIPPRPEGLDLAPYDWADHLRVLAVPPDFLARADPAAYHVRLARLGGDSVATVMAYDHEGDCGIYNVGTLAPARRRGLGTALTALQLDDARRRGCRTASLQATPTAERMYARAGFRDLGRILEYAPGAPGITHQQATADAAQ